MTIRRLCTLVPFRSAVFSALGAVFLIGLASAQDLGEQQGIPVGEGQIYPSIRIDYQSNDNVGLTADDELDGDATIIQPEFVFVADSRNLVFQAGYAGVYSLGSVGPLEWDDHELSAGLAAEFDARRRADVDFSVSRQHTDLGAGLTRGLGNDLDEPVVFDVVQLNAAFGYGVADALGNVTAGVRFQTQNYANLDQVTDGYGFSEVRPYARFGYRIGGDSRFLAEIRASFLEFDLASRSRDELAVLFGLGFTATGRLSGSFNIGFENVDFSTAGQETTTLFVVESNLRYQPTSFAQFTLDVSRGINNTGLGLVAGGSGESIETVVRLGWEHDWSSRFSSKAFVEADLDDEICPTISDSTLSAGLEIGLAVRRWLEIGAGFSSASRDTDSCTVGDGAETLSYDRQLVGVHLRATL